MFFERTSSDVIVECQMSYFKIFVYLWALIMYLRELLNHLILFNIPYIAYLLLLCVYMTLNIAHLFFFLEF